MLNWAEDFSLCSKWHKNGALYEAAKVEERMIEGILPDIYRIEIPLPGSPLKALNSYVIKGPDRSMVVDTGWNREECLTAMRSGLEEAKVDLDKTDFFITHLHADHTGLVEKLVRKGSTVYLGKVDASVFISISRNVEERRDRLYRDYLSHGFPEPELKLAAENHPGFHYGPALSMEFTGVGDGDTLAIGDKAFTCIQTSGHSPGHMCLHDASRKILFSGDHILSDITPNITRWPEMENPLEHYFASLERVYNLELTLILPGHRRIIRNHRKRIQELLDHHNKRLAEVLRALEDGEKTAWDVAPHLSWDIDSPSWELFPPVQKWFALGETIAHLNFLVGRGSVTARNHEGKILFSSTGMSFRPRRTPGEKPNVSK